MARVRVRTCLLTSCTALIIVAFLDLYCFKTIDIFKNSFTRNQTRDQRLLLLTVATKERIGFRAFRRSANLSGMDLKICGMSDSWQGLGSKVRYQRQQFLPFKDDPSKIIMFADAYDVLINGDARAIVRNFQETNHRVLFSAEHNCMPNKPHCAAYPSVPVGKKYLNSGAFIGYATELYEMVKDAPSLIENDQEFYTDVYLNDQVRSRLRIGLDHRCQVFQTFEGGANNVQLTFQGKEAIIHNKDYDTYPLVIHTPGLMKPYIHSLGNFIPQVWDPLQGCTTCLDNVLNLTATPVAHFPIVLIAIFIEQPVARLGEFFLKLHRLKYPKERTHLFIYDAVHQNNETETFLAQRGQDYNSTRLVSRADYSKLAHESRLLATELSQDYCFQKDCEYYFNLEPVVHLDNVDSLKLLIEQHRPVIAPVLFGPDKQSTNFVPGAELSDVVQYNNADGTSSNERRGLWSVRTVATCYLIQSDVLRRYVQRPRFSEPENQDVDVAFSFILTSDEVEILVTNRVHFGTLVHSGKMNCTSLFCKAMSVSRYIETV